MFFHQNEKKKLFCKRPFQYDVIMVRWVGSLKTLIFWWQWWQVDGWWGLIVFLMTNDDPLILSSTTLFVCPFFELLEMKKNVSLLPEKTKTSFFTYLTRFFFFVFVRKNKFPICLALNKEKSDSNFLYLFLLFFFASPVMTIDDRWVGGMELPT